MFRDLPTMIELCGCVLIIASTLVRGRRRSGGGERCRIGGRCRFYVKFKFGQKSLYVGEEGMGGVC